MDNKRKVVVTLSVDSSTHELIPFPTRRIHLDQDNSSVIVGRSSTVLSKGLGAREDNAWFDSPVMSRNHAEIATDMDQRKVQIRDTGSLHGTFLNGENSTIGNGFRALANGDSICFGADVIRGEDTFPPTKVKVHFDFYDGSSEPALPFARPGTYQAPSIDYDTSENDESDSEDDVQAPWTLARPTTYPSCCAVPGSSGTVIREAINLPRRGSNDSIAKDGPNTIDLTGEVSEETGITTKPMSQQLGLSRQADSFMTAQEDHDPLEDLEQATQDSMPHLPRQTLNYVVSTHPSDEAASTSSTDCGQPKINDALSLPDPVSGHGSHTTSHPELAQQARDHPKGEKTEFSVRRDESPIRLDPDDENDVTAPDDISDKRSTGSDCSFDSLCVAAHAHTAQVPSYDMDDDDGDDLFSDYDRFEYSDEPYSLDEEEKFQEGALDCDARSDAADSEFSDIYDGKPPVPECEGPFQSRPTSNTAYPSVTIEGLLNPDGEEYPPLHSRHPTPWTNPIYSVQSQAVPPFPAPQSYHLPMIPSPLQPMYPTQPPCLGFGPRTEALVHKTGKSDFFAAREENKNRFKLMPDLNAPRPHSPELDDNTPCDAAPQTVAGKRKVDQISDVTEADREWAGFSDVPETSRELVDSDVPKPDRQASANALDPDDQNQEAPAVPAEASADTPTLSVGIFSSATQEAHEAEVLARPAKRTRYAKLVRGIGYAALGGFTLSTVVFGSLVHVSPPLT